MKVVIGLLLSILAFAAFAQEEAEETTISTAPGLSRIVSFDASDLAYAGVLAFGHDNGKHADRNTTQFKLNLNYAQSIEQYIGLMWRAQVNVNHDNQSFGSNDVKQSTWGVGGGLLYNFQADDVKNSWLAAATILLERASYDIGTIGRKSGFNVGLNLEGGKRFDLGSYSAANVSYAPTVSFGVKRYGGGIRDDYFKSGTDLRFNFLKFDILF